MGQFIPLWRREWLRRKRLAKTAMAQFHALMGKRWCVECHKVTDNLVEEEGRKVFLCPDCAKEKGH